MPVDAGVSSVRRLPHPSALPSDILPDMLSGIKKGSISQAGERAAYSVRRNKRLKSQEWTNRSLVRFTIIIVEAE